jgi:mitochondrial chaperone BCS1
MDDGGPGGGFATIKDKEVVVVSCYGWSPSKCRVSLLAVFSNTKLHLDPIKNLLQHVKEQYYTGQHKRTVIRRPAPANLRRFGGRHAWLQVASRPVRDMRTVVLDGKQKVQVLADINEYLHPATPRWYANRGIPLRRGYLFHGPPGTGKTSLSFALAGVFGLDIYVISLLDPGLTEEDLSALFNTLPRRCVVLLEDIDTAGLIRANDPKLEEAAKGGEAGDPKEWKVTDLARALKREGEGDKQNKGISLSGLLNAIDGVASHEGRVLIMTTNRPESLDEALIRPGRVDLQVGFTNATKQQAMELFERMYEADQLVAPPAPTASAAAMNGRAHANGSAHHDKDGGGAGDESEEPTDEEEREAEAATAEMLADDERLHMSTGELRAVASDFADRIPDSAFSPAEIQGFLLKRKKNPRRALVEVEKWVEAMLEQKASKTKVLQVQ